MSTSPIQALDLALRRRGDAALPRDILKPLTAYRAEDCVKHARRMLVRTTIRKDFHSDTEYRFKDIERLYQEALDVDCSLYLCEALNYLRLYQALANAIRRVDLASHERWFDSRTLHKRADHLLNALTAVGNFDPNLTSSLLVMGKLYALQGRTHAMRTFALAAPRLPDSQGVLQHDCGAATYFDTSQLETNASSIESHRRTLGKLERHNKNRARHASCTVLMSCNAHYMRTYLPYWLDVAEYLKDRGLAYHVIVTDNNDNAQDLIQLAEDLRRATGKFRGYNPQQYADNVDFSTAAVPPWCANTQAFAACARYLYIRELLDDLNTQIIVQDIDLCMAEDPASWLDGLPSDKLVLTSNSVRHTIDPWRKILGGTVVVPRDRPIARLLRALEDYMVYGLAGNADCWYVDQNALDYMHELAMHHEHGDSDLLESHAALRPAKRPVQGVPIHALFQAQQS